ncbi:hypothetical protein BH11PLA2_BH11PLA2_36750 [soil metagenome]
MKSTLSLTKESQVIHLLRYFARPYPDQVMPCTHQCSQWIESPDGLGERETHSIREAAFFILYALYGNYLNNNDDEVGDDKSLHIELYGLLYTMYYLPNGLKFDKPKIDWRDDDYDVFDQLWNVLTRYSRLLLTVLDPNSHFSDNDDTIISIIDSYSFEVPLES